MANETLRLAGILFISLPRWIVLIGSHLLLRGSRRPAPMIQFETAGDLSFQRLAVKNQSFSKILFCIAKASQLPKQVLARALKTSHYIQMRWSRRAAFTNLGFPC